jgi:outer membrane protein OmpA-like peptidoglycan-associated protein
MLLWLATLALAQQQGAEAQGGFDAHGFRLASYDADLRDPLVVQRPGAFSQGDWFLSGLAEYAKAPLVQVQMPEEGGEPTEVAVVDNLLALNLSAGVAAHERLRFDVLAPVYGLTTGVEQTSQGPAIGDMRVSMMAIGVRPKHITGGGGPGLGVVGYLDLPTGTPGRFLGQQGIGGGAKLAATFEADQITVSGDVGAEFDKAVEGFANVQGTDKVVASLGFGVLASDTVGLTLEGVVQPPIEATTFDLATTAFPAESILSVRYRDASGGHFTIGGAAGITDGPGVAAFRVFVGGGFGSQEPPRPPDFDPVGELRSTDLCPLEAEVVNGWKDDDGCPDELSALAVDVRYQGVSREADAEITGPDGPRMERIGIQGLALDAVPGSRWQVRATSGCLEGSAAATATEAGAQMVIELQPLYDSQVTVEVVGTDDQPLPDAQVLWQSDSPECIPAQPTAVDPATGALTQKIAFGTHTVKVTAPFHTLHEEEVTFRKGDAKTLQVKLGAALISVEKKQIKILEKVQFETGKAVIKPESFGLLNEVAATIITNPDLGRVEVSGHTDSRGGEDFNQKLSERRAESVRTYLVEQGVSEQRLLAVGYGETKPIDTNKTVEGREANRRVEFNLIDADDGDDSEGGTP